jgi:hypothetical protein
MGKWWKAQQKQARKIAARKAAKAGISIAINGKDLSTLTDADLAGIARGAGLPEINKVGSTSMSGGVAVPTVTTVTLATASRHELVTLLASKSPFVKKQQKAEIAKPHLVPVAGPSNPTKKQLARQAERRAARKAGKAA